MIGRIKAGGGSKVNGLVQEYIAGENIESGDFVKISDPQQSVFTSIISYYGLHNAFVTDNYVITISPDSTSAGSTSSMKIYKVENNVLTVIGSQSVFYTPSGRSPNFKYIVLENSIETLRFMLVECYSNFYPMAQVYTLNKTNNTISTSTSTQISSYNAYRSFDAVKDQNNNVIVSSYGNYGSPSSSSTQESRLYFLTATNNTITINQDVSIESKGTYDSPANWRFYIIALTNNIIFYQAYNTSNGNRYYKFIDYTNINNINIGTSTTDNKLYYSCNNYYYTWSNKLYVGSNVYSTENNTITSIGTLQSELVDDIYNIQNYDSFDLSVLQNSESGSTTYTLTTSYNKRDLTNFKYYYTTQKKAIKQTNPTKGSTFARNPQSNVIFAYRSAYTQASYNIALVDISKMSIQVSKVSQSTDTILGVATKGGITDATIQVTTPNYS